MAALFLDLSRTDFSHMISNARSLICTHRNENLSVKETKLRPIPTIQTVLEHPLTDTVKQGMGMRNKAAHKPLQIALWNLRASMREMRLTPTFTACLDLHPMNCSVLARKPRVYLAVLPVLPSFPVPLSVTVMYKRGIIPTVAAMTCSENHLAELSLLTP